ncbi:MAG: peptide chain release factor N(5)-glutamine methyltransferase [Nitrospinae bacterium]|nr:peptide chain release factor N(5)-glutamine methyltransferase [Nitrospinota bacterium]MZH42255.1 peptide chain release factor N(5)-glutamine methyltransferase [Nitrospinota bacterium]MZH45911.1 peptide chain release factor N(5)-glutamine methyltransferase [Nitrospinota bacterium]
MEIIEETAMDHCSTLSSLLDWAQQKLLRAEVASPRLDAEILMAAGLDISRTELMTHPERVLTRSQIKRFCSSIERRVLREPVSHITGIQEFWSLEFVVNEKVLTPRPETEVLVEQCLGLLKQKSSPTNILDLGTGSGVLAVVLARELPQCKITAIESSNLEVARKNAFLHDVADRICFMAADFMKKDWQGPYHLIVSNPPYIESKNIIQCMPEVRQYEPVQALDGGRDGLDYYRYIIPMAWKKLQIGGWLALEIGHNQAAPVIELMRNCSGYQDIQAVQDYSGYDRVVLACKRVVNG